MHTILRQKSSESIFHCTSQARAGVVQSLPVCTCVSVDGGVRPIFSQMLDEILLVNKPGNFQILMLYIFTMTTP